MPTPQNLMHIQHETDRYIREQAANANPFGSMDPTGGTRLAQAASNPASNAALHTLQDPTWLLHAQR
jgi:hypothetical protein